ncbi:Conidial pigment polyketide synthase PfmaE like protein [Verticillium longisporum]|nr:Conidial pigment polyketide synthase PfmaE like protein [Verticillium longisporum]
MVGTMSFLLFGDQSLNTHAFLAEFYRLGAPSILAKTFLEQAGQALREEIDVAHEDTYILGLCTGLFAAAAVASTGSVSTLIPLAVQTVLMAFRTGSHVASLAERLCPATSRSDPWTHVLVDVTEADVNKALQSFHSSHTVLMAFRTGSHVASLAERLCPATDRSDPWTHVLVDVTEADVNKALRSFHSSHSVPPPSQAYISAVSTHRLAVSGPPTTLKALVESNLLGAQSTSIPVYGPYHSAHLHSGVDIDKLLGLDDVNITRLLEQTRPRSAVMSGARGTWIASLDTKDLIQLLQFHKGLELCVETAQAFDGTSCLVIPFGPTTNAESLSSLIRQKTKLTVITCQPPKVTNNSDAHIGNHGSSGKCKLAIVGMAGRFPDAASHEKLWELLSQGLDVHRVVPADRFNIDTHYDITGKAINTSHTQYGCWIENPGFFDPRFFNMSPREAYQTDPMQRMALTTAYEALEMSGYVPNRTASTRLDRIGTFYGQTSDDWREINAAQEVDTYFITGGVRAFGPGRINYHFGFSGPSLNIDTACSSSAAALQIACTSLWAKDCDTAVVGGLSCMTNPDIFSGLSRGQFLSKTGPCATFDNGADGYCRADGCASVVVKRLDDAIADKDNVLAVILGTATNHSADAISITHPHGPTQSILSSAILDEAGVDPLDVDYVEMHGTGTQAGDGTEMVSVTDVFAPANRKRPADRPLYLGAVKSNIGHGEAASGVTALCKVLMMLQKNAIPPHVGIKKDINKTFPKDLAERNVNIAFHMTPLKRHDGKPRRIFINNFSAAGGNTGLLLEDGPSQTPTQADPRSAQVITITAKIPKPRLLMLLTPQRPVACNTTGA